MRVSSLAPCLGLAILMVGCTTASQFVADMRGYLLGRYQSTPEQIAVANDRGEAAVANLPATEAKPRYIAVRTTDPNLAQRKEIRERAKKEDSYGGAPGVIYCLMIYDTTRLEVIGTQCYAVARLPYDGEKFTFDTYDLTYIASES